MRLTPETKELREQFYTNLAADCLRYELTPEQSLEYFKLKYGRPVSMTTINKYKRRANSEPEASFWISKFARFGSILAHKKLIEDLEAMHANNMYHFYKLKDSQDREDLSLALAIKNNSIALADRLAKLYDTMPIVAATKSLIDKAMAGQYEQEKASVETIDNQNKKPVLCP